MTSMDILILITSHITKITSNPFNRRSLWELIEKSKEGRCILLTTHFMEEADVLSDRIAIMNHGQIKCCGSPFFLKNTFGSGYRVAIAKNNDFVETSFVKFLKKHVEKYFIETNIAAEMSISIPYELSSKLPPMLKEMEENKAHYGIDGYGVSSPTIEEIFIKIGSIDKKDMDQNNKEEFNDTHLIANKDDLSNVIQKFKFFLNRYCCDVKSEKTNKEYSLINIVLDKNGGWSGCYKFTLN
ncbi:ATP-binding cassette sub-family A ABCA1 [Brachionus plicatilis]|uniref:ATP-binding cassette sub-family A ABCA1 n=1 Tax=Brachionus plicatilis TaxID=10195 RepID=A0A3M7RMT8_BRAPC|nr:ATP-binding cassette sub-family A ABCA1 [Brachionus plicatilis]